MVRPYRYVQEIFQSIIPDHKSMSIPNQITILRFLLTPAFAYAFFQEGLSWRIIMLVFFTLGSTTDKLDGYLARKYNWETSLGKFLDPLADKVLVITSFILLIFFGYAKTWMVVVIVLRDLIITWMRSYSNRLGKPLHTLTIAQWKTMLQMIAIFIALVYIVGVEILNHYHIRWGVWEAIDRYQLILTMMFLVTLFTAITGIVYVLYNRHLFKKAFNTA